MQASAETLKVTDLVTIIDFGVGNVGSIFNMVRRIHANVVVTADPRSIETSSRLILPGVGSFDAGMESLHKHKLGPILDHAVLELKIPILGICLGMQLLAKTSEEGNLPGLGWLDASVKKFDLGRMEKEAKIPHMGWNEINPVKPHPLVAHFETPPRFYFVHSYHLVCESDADVLANCHYGYDFAAVIGNGNILGTQFHPEKSHKFGYQILTNFLGEL